MRVGHLVALVTTAAFSVAVSAQEGPIPEPRPLRAHYVLPHGVMIGGGPEAQAVAEAIGAAQANICGATGAVPLLTQGIIALAVLPREMTPIERAAVRRFSGGTPLMLPLREGLFAYVRRDRDGSIDERLVPVIRRLLSVEGQASLADALPDYHALASSAHATSISQIALIPSAPVPQARPGYTGADGSLAIIGSDTLVTLMPDLLAAYARHAPKQRFSTDLRGSSTAMPALTAGMTIFAPMGRELWQNDLDAFRQVKGYGPTRLRIAYSSHGPRTNGKTPPAIYVNAANPIAGLSLPQIRRIFAAGAAGGDIRNWAQLGMRAGEIHVYGAPDDGGFGTAMRLSKLDGLPFSARYRALNGGKAILTAVAADPSAIGYATWMDANAAPAGVRVLALSELDGDSYSLPDAGGDRGRWPISYFFNIYVDKKSGEALPASTKELLRFFLSDEGQAIIGRHSDEEDGYLPLSPHDLRAERELLDNL
ncbi:hypothetical protein E5554_01825 [Sphingobium sp. PAMC28499]|nr:hypothetical protein E5554_01825 [Sphingobium sp. PAMC28499]